SPLATHSLYLYFFLLLLPHPPISTLFPYTTLFRSILKLLEEYDSQATFFLPGIKSAEDPETVQMIASSGQEIGNYTLSAQRELDSLDTDSIINDFAKASVVLKNITRETLTLLKANDSDYTTELLKSASSIGVESVVESSVF